MRRKVWTDVSGLCMTCGVSRDLNPGETTDAVRVWSTRHVNNNPGHAVHVTTAKVREYR